MSGLFSKDGGLRVLGWGIHGLGVMSLVVGALVYHFGVFTLITRQQQRNEAEADRLERLVARKSEVEQELRDVSTRLVELQQRARRMRDGIPDEPRASEFLRHVTEAADAENLRIQDYETYPARKLESHSQLDVRLHGRGRYDSICGFLERLAGLSRVMTVQRMQVNGGSPGAAYPFDMTLTLYFGARRTAG